MGFWEWFGLMTGSATMISFAIAIAGWFTSVASTRAVQHMHEATQRTLLGTHQILERMDQRAEDRYRDLRGRLDGEV